MRLSTIKIFYQIVRGLMNTLSDLKSAIPIFHFYDVIIFTETWLAFEILSTDLFGSLTRNDIEIISMPTKNLSVLGLLQTV
jgi:hypothetical protein